MNRFTLHCLAWHAAMPLLLEVRAAACEIGLLGLSDSQADDADARCLHGLVLGSDGRAIGCARITAEGKIERIAVLPHENRAGIERALIETLREHSREDERLSRPGQKSVHKGQLSSLAA